MVCKNFKFYFRHAVSEDGQNLAIFWSMLLTYFREEKKSGENIP